VLAIRLSTLVVASNERNAPYSPAEDPAVLGTAEEARKAGFLCVISLLSTLRRFFVTSEPRLSSANTAATPPLPAAGAGERGGGGGAGGGGGGGGGGALPAAAGGAAALYSEIDIPCDMASAYAQPGRCTNFAYSRVPDKSCGVMFHHVLLHVVKDSSECPDPLYVRLISAQEE
jgi:hypothetical protein